MHFEILVEDISGTQALKILIPKILGASASFRIHPYRGLGQIPRNLKNATDPGKRILLANLPKLLRGYGKTFASYGPEYKAAVIVICDLDDRALTTFLRELNGVLRICNPKPETHFCIAIEEGEAWLLGDVTAIRLAYPYAKRAVLDSYVNDSICGTWEKMADAVYPGGSKALAAKGWQTAGIEKSRWAEQIPPHMNVEKNRSPSFQSFVTQLRSFFNVGKVDGGIQ